jgi:alpha-tubulin suppressor-like RCC1 family protein
VRVAAVAAGWQHSLALSETGEVYSFGNGAYGQLGHGDQEDQHTPRPIAALQGMRVGIIAAGDQHSLVVSTAGRLYSFGHGGQGALATRAVSTRPDWSQRCRVCASRRWRRVRHTLWP